MSKEKRTFKSETLSPAALRLEPIVRQPDQIQDQYQQSPRRKSAFTPELIARLAERIKKL
jgi:hypothetical protein